MAYKELKIIKYQQYDAQEDEYQRRLTSFGVIKTEMFPYLMQRGSFKSHQYPLFVVPLLELQLLSQKIQENSTKIKEIANLLPPVAHNQFYTEQLYKAVINTNEIEGIKTTRKDVSEAYQALQESSPKDIRLLSTVRMYHDIADNQLLTIDHLSVIRDIYDKLTEGEIDEENQLDGELFRDNIVSIVDQHSGKVEHIAPSTEKQIYLMLTSWIQFINDETIPFLIKATLGHFFFENIHPFYDGNGRTGRYILSRYLARKLDIFSGLVISQKINENKNRYYKAFSTTGDIDNRAEGTFFVQTMLELIEEGQKDIINILKEKKAILDHFWQRMKENRDLAEIQKHILFLLLQSTTFVNHPKEGLTDRAIIDILASDFPRKTIKDNITKLREKGMIVQISRKPSRHQLLITDE
ncbi:cell filamentation protein Fic [Streptococcus cuniculi]|uniref:Cell filamentation protein Fic n=1 Tax=Streptococcus cuniculi TaxID=1432788 RepID=A0A1Q8E6Q5_9STRE|nr:Fic family protein [Streptococcus cuniculi]OLF47456.1 cell filamentation protein Fic [Streptococcus cuniculi]